jgi:hypothetical protein
MPFARKSLLPKRISGYLREPVRKTWKQGCECQGKIQKLSKTKHLRGARTSGAVGQHLRFAQASYAIKGACEERAMAGQRKPRSLGYAHSSIAAGLGSRRLRRGRRLASRRQRTGREPQPPAVRVPIQLWRSERGGGGVTPESVAAVAEALPVKTAVRTVPNAQHFAFLPPCPDELARSAQELCTDPPGFDREAFHTEFNAQVLDFFRRSLR